MCARGADTHWGVLRGVMFFQVATDPSDGEGVAVMSIDGNTFNLLFHEELNAVALNGFY